MTYETLRHFADSWALLALTILFLTLVGWTFLPNARRNAERAATSILEDEDRIDG